MPAMPMFPLGTVLFPHVPLPLRVFEPRYLLMLGELLKSDRAAFGVVLIERGHEVGGGEGRFSVGTVAEITQLDAQEGYVGLVARGTRRFEVTEWLDDAPYPRAEVRNLPDLEWDPDLAPRLAEAERLVRRTLAQASEFSEDVWPADVELSAEPLAAAWQLAAITPVLPLDQLRLLRASSVAELLDGVIRLTGEAAELYQLRWPGDDEALG